MPIPSFCQPGSIFSADSLLNSGMLRIPSVDGGALLITARRLQIMHPPGKFLSFASSLHCWLVSLLIFYLLPLSSFRHPTNTCYLKVVKATDTHTHTDAGTRLLRDRDKPFSSVGGLVIRAFGLCGTSTYPLSAQFYREDGAGVLGGLRAFRWFPKSGWRLNCNCTVVQLHKFCFYHICSFF